MLPRERKWSKSAPASMSITSSRSGKWRRKWDDLSMRKLQRRLKKGQREINELRARKAGESRRKSTQGIREKKEKSKVN